MTQFDKFKDEEIRLIEGQLQFFPPEHPVASRLLAVIGVEMKIRHIARAMSAEGRI